MLQIQHICKEYKTGDLIQKALDDVSLNLRDNEFVAILGPSGSGKTTLLNLIGGLDRYDSGDLIINGISTKKYKDRDWDSYRNHTIGFVFQSYNLIPHQTVLANVELALTISGTDKTKRRERAVRALEQVGLGSQLHKKPNQMSGGQMQRVAIARALVNDPDILLADEPTGALDSETSIQVMELLKEVAKDRLVVMVTHNPELAQQYATRIVNLKDGKIQTDSDPFVTDPDTLQKPEHQNMGKASMSFLTALSLSFHNLRTKKARTLLTSFAGSIGIIGIALILSLSTGVNDYIKSIEEETLSEYPLQIQSTGFDLSSMLVSDTPDSSKDSGDIKVMQMVTDMFSTMDANDLESLKSYLESEESGIQNYTNAVEYSYGIVPQIYREDGEEIRQVSPDRSFDALGFGSAAGSNSMMSTMMSTDMFYEMPESRELYESQYDVKAGRWPREYNECVVVLSSGGGISDLMLYTLGLRDQMELDEMIRQFINEENVDTPEEIGSYSYEDILGRTFKLVNSSDYYEYDEQYHVWKDKTGNEEYMRNLVKSGEDLTIVGVVQPAKGASAAALSAGIGYPASLTTYIAEQAEASPIVEQQKTNPQINVFTNEPFGENAGASEPDMGSMFTIDENALRNAFRFQEDAMVQGLGNALSFSEALGAESGSLDLSGIQGIGNIQITLPDMPAMSLEELLTGLDLSVSASGMGNMAASLLEGYRQYAEENPQADYSGLGKDFLNYLTTEEAKIILEEHIRDIIGAGGITVSTEQLQAMAEELMQGYFGYVQKNGYTDPEKFDEYFLQYLQQAEAQEILVRWGKEIFQISGNVEITSGQLADLAADLAEGYQNYAAANGLPDPSKMGEHFINYLNTPDGKKRLSEGLAQAVDLKSLETQIMDRVKSYVEQTTGVYTQAVSQALASEISSAMQKFSGELVSSMERALQTMAGQTASRFSEMMGSAMTIDSEAFAQVFQMNMDADAFMELMMSMNTDETASYENNMKSLGWVDFDSPSAIDIYPKDFESKENVLGILDAYNERMQKEGAEDKVITYTDVVGTLMSSVTDIIDIISYVLIAFVAISLIVSSIMIGVITYISVLERKKEIGILRAIGASKGNISQVFNAETCIIGFCAGVIGIVITLLLLIPGNALIHHLAGTEDVNAVLPAVPAFLLIMISILLTVTGGLIPSKKAAKSDPVTALRTE